MAYDELAADNWSHMNANEKLATIFLITWTVNQHNKLPVKIMAFPALVFS